MYRICLVFLGFSWLFISCNNDYLQLFNGENNYNFTPKDSVVNNGPKEPLFQSVEYNKIQGTEANLLSLDVYYDSQIQVLKPVVVWVHGGGWTSGDKALNIQNKAILFRDNDYVFISVNYRLSPYPFELFNSSRIKYPIHHTDVLDAIHWIQQNIENYGGDSQKIVIMGHSAGAHLVSLIGTWPEIVYEKDISMSSIKGVVSLDTEGYDVRPRTSEGNVMYINAFGNDADENRVASPLYHIKSHNERPKFLVIKRGDYNRIQLSNQFITKLKDNNHEVYEWDGSIYNHMEIDEMIGKEGENQLTPQILSFLENCF